VENTQTCPACGESIKKGALICRFCHTDLQTDAKPIEGRFIAVRVRAGQKTYVGDIFVPEKVKRLSDVLNDKRIFIVLTNTVEETGIRDIPIGFLAINKNNTEHVELKEENEETAFKGVCHIIGWK
jgi:hypothetical protein